LGFSPPILKKCDFGLNCHDWLHIKLENTR
jgi:hypothetical protein